MDEPIRQQVQIPEKEANALLRKLRHDSKLAGLGISVRAYVGKTGTRALQVQVDKAKDDGDYDRYDLNYKADADLGVLHRNAVKRITAHFA